jgi:hypothetical protein
VCFCIITSSEFFFLLTNYVILCKGFTLKMDYEREIWKWKENDVLILGKKFMKISHEKKRVLYTVFLGVDICSSFCMVSHNVHTWLHGLQRLLHNFTWFLLYCIYLPEMMRWAQLTLVILLLPQVCVHCIHWLHKSHTIFWLTWFSLPFIWNDLLQCFFKMIAKKR